MDVLSVACGQAKFEERLNLICFTGVVQRFWNVVGGQVEVEFDGVAIGGSNHTVLNLIASFFIGVGDGLKMPSTKPMIVSSLVSDGLGKFPGVHPAVDVHVNVEFLWSVSEHQSEDASKRVRFTVTHDEFPFVVAHGAVGA